MQRAGLISALAVGRGLGSGGGLEAIYFTGVLARRKKSVPSWLDAGIVSSTRCS